MTINNTAISSVVLWPNINYGGSSGAQVSNGQAGILAADIGVWSYQSVGINGMQLFVWTAPDTSTPGYSFSGHIESLLDTSQPNLPSLYSGAEYPLQYIGINPAEVAVLMVNIVSSGTAVALSPSQSYPDTGVPMNTFAAPGFSGALGFVSVSTGSSVVVSVQYGDYSGNGSVTWNGFGSLTLSWNGSAPVISGVTGLPAGWNFSTPVKQADGSWGVTLNTGAAVDTGVLYTGANYSGSSKALTPHLLTQLNSGIGWTYNSLKLYEMSALIYSSFSPTNTGYNYTNYQEQLLTTDTANFAASFTGSTPISLLSLDGSDVVVDLVLNTTEASDSALVLTQSYPLAFYTFISTSRSGLLSVLPASGAPQTISISYGSLDTSGHFSAAGSGTLSVSLVNGVPVITPDGSLPSSWNFSTPAQQTDGSWRVSLSDQQSVSALSLYSQTYFSGTAVELAEHQAATLRNLMNQWQYRSVRLQGLHWLSHSVYAAQNTGYDYRQYLDNYSVTDIADLTSNYQLAGSQVDGIALGVNDVVVRVQLVPQGSKQNVVLSAVQGWPMQYSTASLYKDGANQNGILMVFDKTQPLRTVNIQIGSLNNDGTAAWQTSTTVTASWNSHLQLPVLALASDAPADLQFQSIQATSKSGEFTTILSGEFVTKKIKVMGARCHRLGFYENTNNTLAAVDMNTQKPVYALWRYQDQGTPVLATWFTDTRPGTKLLVSTPSSTDSVLLNESNIIGSGVNFYCALAARNDSGVVSSWGDSGNGGIPPVSAANHDVIQVVASSMAMVALNQYGQVFGWGGPDSGGTVPTEIAYLNDIVSIYAGNAAIAAIRSTGHVVSWGHNAEMPTNIAALSDVTKVSCGRDFFTALRASGQVVNWGPNITQPAEIARLTDIVDIASSPGAAAAIRANGQIAVWGDSEYGGEYSSYVAKLTDIKRVVAGGYCFAALRGNGSVVSWGNSNYGGGVPGAIAALTNIVSVAASGGAFAALCSDGSVVAWGNSAWGGFVPAEIKNLRNVVAITGSDRAFAALCADGTVYAWGDDNYGAIVPVTVSDVRAVYAASFGFCALTNNHNLIAWGGGGIATDGIPANLQGYTSYALSE